MLIRCPNCATSYDVKPDSLGASGRVVRCAKCTTQWFATAPAPEMALASEWDDVLTDDRGHDIRAAAMAETADTHRDDFASVPALASTPSLVPESAGQTIDATAITHIDLSEPSEDIETVAARREQKDAAVQGRRRFPVVLAILALAAILGALLVWRADVVRHAPQAAALYGRIGLAVNLRGLAFEDVKTSGETHDGVPVMVIAGTIVNVAKQAVDVPRLRFALRNPAGVEVYAWTAQPPQPSLAAGEAIPFRTRLASPPPDGRDLQLRFFNRRDLESGR